MAMNQEDNNRDGVKAEPVANKYGNLLEMLRDIDLSPVWRPLADKCADYFDGNQLSTEAIADLKAKGMPDFNINLIAPTILTVLGMEEKTRTDWTVVVEEGEDEAVDGLAEALAVKMHDAEKETKADVACSEAYKAAVVPGIGWVEVARESNPFKGKYRIEYVHRSEMDFDWRDRTMDLSKARFQVRRKWYDNDVLQAMFPEHADKIGSITAGGGWNEWYTRFAEQTGLAQGFEYDINLSLEEAEWRDIGRRRTCLFEVWYKIYEPTHAMKVGKRVVEFKLENPAHCEAVQAGLVKLEPTVIERVRQAYWVGPCCLVDRPTPYPHNKFPYVPCFGFREDLTGIPYGMVRHMIGSQDEFNARRAKMYWLLSTRRVTADADVVEDHQHAANEVAKGNSYIVLSGKRNPNSKFIVEENRELATDQFKIMQDAGENIQRTAGIQQTLMNPTASSGLAKQVDIEQGVTSLARLNGNYRNFRMEVGNMLLDLIKEDIGQETQQVQVGKDAKKKIVTLNEPAGQVGQYQTFRNDVQKSMAKCDLDTVPASATYRQHLITQLIEMTKGLSPQAQAVVVPYVIEGSDLPMRHEMVEEFRKVMGLDKLKEGEEGAEGQPQIPPELMQQMEQMQAALEQMQGELVKKDEEIQAAKSQNLDIKREIEMVRLEKEKLGLIPEQPVGPDLVNAKLELLAEQVGRLSKAVLQ
jgi:hypothetical protein